jgi:hypothetical protein
MAKHILIMSSAAALALAAGMASAETITNKSGNSTSTVTQEGGGPVKQKVIKTPDGQKIITQSGGNSSTVTQKGGSSRSSSKIDSGPMEDDSEMETEECPEKPAKGKKSADDEDCPDSLTELEDNLEMRRRALDSTARNEPRRFGPGFENAQALKEWMDRVRRQ